MDILSRLDSEYRELFVQFRRLDITDIPAARAEVASRLTPLGRSGAEAVTRAEIQISTDSASGGVPVRTYTPVGAMSSMPCLVWSHGGGHVMGDVGRDDAKLARLAETVGCVVVSVDWRKSPENPYPASHEDTYGALLWVVEHAAELRVDPGRIAVGGHSSGGGLAAATALRARDEAGPSICFQLLIEPMLDDRNTTRSSRAITDPRLWSRETNRLAWNAYLGERAGADDVPIYAAPARATDLAGLPSSFISVGDLDLFVDEDVAYASRLLEAGVPTELHVYPGAIHGFDMFLPDSTLGRRAARDRHEALARAFARPGSTAQIFDGR